MTKCELTYIQLAKSISQPLLDVHVCTLGSMKTCSFVSIQIRFVAFHAATPAFSSTIPRTMRYP